MKMRSQILGILILSLTQSSFADRLKSEAYAGKACEAMQKTSEAVGSSREGSYSKVALSCARTLDDCLIENPSGYNDSKPWDASDLNAHPGMSRKEQVAALGWCDKAEKKIADKTCQSFLTKRIESYGEEKDDAGDPNSNNYSSRCLMKSWDRKLLEPAPGGGFFQRLFRSGQPSSK